MVNRSPNPLRHTVFRSLLELAALTRLSDDLSRVGDRRDQEVNHCLTLTVVLSQHLLVFSPQLIEVPTIRSARQDISVGVVTLCHVL